MSVVERRMDLIRAVAEAYTGTIQERVTQQSNEIVTQINATIINLQSTPNCTTCVDTFVDLDQIKRTIAEDWYACAGDRDCENSSTAFQILNSIRGCDGVCGGLCAICSSSVANNSVIFDANSTVQNTTPEENDKIYTDVLKTLNKKYDETFEPTKKDIIAIIEGKSAGIEETSTQNVNLSTTINQIVTTTTAVVVTGAGARLKNVSLMIAVNAIMDAIVKNSINVVNDSIYDSVSKMKQQIDEAITDSLESVFNEAKWYFIWTGIVIGVLLILIIVMLFIRAFRRRAKAS
jgi:hypothetical protein